jgi:hypothetical protein
VTTIAIDLPSYSNIVSRSMQGDEILHTLTLDNPSSIYLHKKLLVPLLNYGIIPPMSTGKNEETRPMKKSDTESTRPSAPAEAPSSETKPAKKSKAAIDSAAGTPVVNTETHTLTLDELESALQVEKENVTRRGRGSRIVLLDVGNGEIYVDINKHSMTEIRRAVQTGNLRKIAERQSQSGWRWLGVLGLFVIFALGCLIGYGMAIKARQDAELQQRLTAATTQYMLSLQDIENNDLAMAKTRLEYVIQIYPEYPDATVKLTEVMVALAQTNPEAALNPSVATPVPTVDARSLETMYQQAQQQLASQDWENLFATVNALRNLDPTYNAVKVDGMYYVALRNVAINRINSGNLETGMYYITLAGKIGPVDTDAQAAYNRAQMFLNASANFGAAWERALNGFETLYSMYPYMIDVNGVTVTQRYAESLKGYGDLLQVSLDWCGAVEKYEQSLNIMSLDSTNAIIEDARAKCANPPPTPTPTLEPWVTPTVQD